MTAPIPFHRPSIGVAEAAAVGRVLASGWLTMGEQVLAFEEGLKGVTDAAEIVAVNSCTAALHLSLLAYGIGPGDEVIVPTLTFAATGNVVAHTGARPVLVDVDPVTGNIDTDAVLAAVTPQTKAVIPVHLAGQPCDMNPLIDIATDRFMAGNDLHIIEDAAHAIGATHRDWKVGSIGSATCFSFYATKNLTTGEGGAVAIDIPKIADRIRRLRLHGLSRDAWKRYGAGGSWRYAIEECGWKCNMTDLNAAIGLAQLEKFAAMQARRAAIADRYTAAFSKRADLILPVLRPGRTTAHHLYPVRVAARRRDGVIEALATRGIGCSVHFIPLHLHPFYQRAYGYTDGDFPVAESWAETEISLPLYPALTDEEVERVIAAVGEVLDDSE